MAPFTQTTAIERKYVERENRSLSGNRPLPLLVVARTTNGKEGVDGSSPSEGLLELGSRCKAMSAVQVAKKACAT
jgi:hypothetical protein